MTRLTENDFDFIARLLATISHLDRAFESAFTSCLMSSFFVMVSPCLSFGLSDAVGGSGNQGRIIGAQDVVHVDSNCTSGNIFCHVFGCVATVCMIVRRSDVSV